MTRRHKILIMVLTVLIAIQFFQPDRNINTQPMLSDIKNHFNVPENVAGTLQTACYDCHSNNTRYPWYTNIQPVGWILAKHIKDGKADLNFNEFGNYSPRRQESKLKAIRNSIKDGSMPISSYTLLHSNAKLSEESKALIIDWAVKAEDSLSTQSKSGVQ